MSAVLANIIIGNLEPVAIFSLLAYSGHNIVVWWKESEVKGEGEGVEGEKLEGVEGAQVG